MSQPPSFPDKRSLSATTQRRPAQDTHSGSSRTAGVTEKPGGHPQLWGRVPVLSHPLGVAPGYETLLGRPKCPLATLVAETASWEWLHLKLNCLSLWTNVLSGGRGGLVSLPRPRGPHWRPREAVGKGTETGNSSSGSCPPHPHGG